MSLRSHLDNLHNPIEQFLKQRFSRTTNITEEKKLENKRKKSQIEQKELEVQSTLDNKKQARQIAEKIEDRENQMALLEKNTIIRPPKEPTFRSPIEKMFWEVWQAHSGTRLIPQYKIGKYRVDFAHPATKVAIELDGLAAHKTTEQIANDRRRQREIEAKGWKVIRFGGKEIYHDAHQCAVETENIIKTQQKKKK